MPKIKTDEQMRSEYIPKIRAFADERLTSENAKRIYNFLHPYHYDTGGRHLYQAAKGILQSDVYSEFPAEDNMGYFETLDGNGLLKWLEIAKFADKEYEHLPGGYEKLKAHSLDENSPMYQEYQNKLWNTAIRSMALTLSDKQPYFLEFFWNRLSYIENILEKGFPTRNELNEKIECEYKKVFGAASEDDLTSFHSEVEVKSKIRSELRDISMTVEMIQALWIKDDVLGDAYQFFTEESKDNQVHLAVFEYLENAEHDYLAERVFDRVTLSYEDYLDEVKKLPVDKIIEAAYKIVIFSDIQTSLDPCTSNFDTTQLRAIASFADPLWSIYEEWQDRDVSHMDDLTDTIKDAADRQTAANKENEYEIDPDPFGFDDEEAEDGQEP